MKRLYIVYVISISFFILLSCNYSTNNQSSLIREHNTRYDSIIDYFETRQKKPLESSITKIFVLTENGCMPCNKKFSALIKENLNDQSSVFLIGATGSYFDISEFSSLKNVFIDQSIMETEYEMFHQSKVIYLKNKQIDTIVTIDARQIERQFEIIKHHF